MLKFFTRMERTRKYVIGLFAFLMVLGMVVAGVTLLKKKFESRFGGQFSLAQIGMTSDRLLDQAINSRVALQEARRLGFNASDEEVRDEIARQFSDPATGKFDVKLYKDYVVRNYGSVGLFEPKKNIRYVFINQEKVGQKLAIPDEDLRKEYEALKPENKMAGVRVQQIVLKVARPELDQEVLGKASAIVARIRKDDLTASEEEFSEQARGNSEDPATAQGGGWLPNPVKRTPNRKPNAAGTAGNVNDLLQNTLDWKEGQVGDPLKTGNAYYIFRRGPVVPKTFEDAKQELLVSLRNRRSYAAAQSVAQKAQERLKETHDVAKVAQEFAAEANMSPAEMTKETGFVKPGDDVPDIGSSPQFEEAIKPLEEPNQVGDRVGIKGGFAIPMLAEKRDPRVPEFDEVKDRVAADLKRSRAAEQLEQTARDLASNSASPDALKAAAEKLGLKAQDEEAFHLGRPLGSAGADPAIDAAVYALKAGETTKTPVKVGDSWVVLGVRKRDDAKAEDFEKRKAELVDRSMNERRD